jgi:hypothetical protein
MSHRSARIRGVTAVTGVLVLGLSTLAAASETTVSTETREPGRQLEVLDLGGAPLEELRLRHRRPEPFEVRVTDTDQDPGSGFTVDTTMNNLHLIDGEGHSADHAIASEHVELSFPGNPLAAAGLSVDLEPRYLLSTTQDIDCSTVGSLLGLDLTDLLAGDPLCSLLADLHDVGLGGLTDDHKMAFAGVELIGALLDAIDLDGLDLPALPLVPGHGDAGAYTDPNCSTGIGAAFCEGTTATARQALRGEAATDLAAELEALLQDHLDATAPLVGDDGLVSVADVLAALTTSDVPLVDEGGAALGDTVASFGHALQEYDTADQVELLNDLLAAALQDLGLDDLLHLTGRYSSYPALTVDTDGATVGGEYEGTLTVTLIE